MSREGDLIRKALKRSVLPELQRLGFVGRNANLQRIDSDWLDLLSIQYGKYGGEFVLEFARCRRGPLHTSWGEVVSEEKREVAHVDPRHRARLEQRGPGSNVRLRGFRFSGFGEDLDRYEHLACQVAALLPQVDKWLRTGQLGSHVHSVGAWPHGAVDGA